LPSRRPPDHRRCCAASARAGQHWQRSFQEGLASGENTLQRAFAYLQRFHLAGGRDGGQPRSPGQKLDLPDHATRPKLPDVPNALQMIHKLQGNQARDDAVHGRGMLALPHQNCVDPKMHRLAIAKRVDRAARSRARPKTGECSEARCERAMLLRQANESSYSIRFRLQWRTQYTAAASGRKP
jgi:hypothetical protein